MLTLVTLMWTLSTCASKLPVLLTVCAAVLAINLDTTIVNVALPSISTDLEAGTRSLQWIVDGYNLAFHTRCRWTPVIPAIKTRKSQSHVWTAIANITAIRQPLT